MYLMRAFIILAIVGATAGAGYYFGHMRNEEVCYEEIKKEITRTQETLDLWKAKPPANSSITSMDAIECDRSILSPSSALIASPKLSLPYNLLGSAKGI